MVLEHMRDLNHSIQRWLEKNLEYIDFVIPLEKSLVTDPVQAMFCGKIERMFQVRTVLKESGFENDITILRTEYPGRDLSIVDVLNQGCSNATHWRGGPIIEASPANRSWPLVITTTTLKCLPSQVCHLSWEMHRKNCLAEVGRPRNPMIRTGLPPLSSRCWEFA